MLKDKTVVVTGANGGIGSAVIETCARYGASVVAVSRKPDTKFTGTCSTLSACFGVSIRCFHFDLTNRGEMKNAYREIADSGETPSVIVNNAGVAHGGLFQMTSLDTIRSVFETNFFSQLEFTQMFARSLIKRRNGSVINVASIAGCDLSEGNIAYGVSKACVIAATKTLAAELGASGIRVNAVAPGLIDTRMAKQMDPKAAGDMIIRSAMGRLGHASEVAEVIAFLASDRASFVNGQTIRVDGGVR